MLVTESLSLARGPRCLLSNLSITIRAGECWLVLGENGCGKSTLLATLAGWQLPAAGRIMLAGRPLDQTPRRERSRQMAWLAQQDEQAFPQTVLERVLTGRFPHLARWQWESEADVALARAQLARLDLAGLAGRDLAALSGGERRRVGLATVLAQEAPLLLLDEPLSQLDVRHQQQALQVLRDCVAQGTAVLMVSHDPNHAVQIASHVLLLFGDGRYLAGPVSDVLTAAHLGELYRHPVRELQDGGRRWFMPS